MDAAVESTLEEGILTLDEENSLHRYLDHFNITASQVDDNGVLTTKVQAAVIREISEGIVPQRQNIAGRVPFNLMKSEQLVWVMDEVDYLETVTWRERCGTSHGLSIRVARGVYYRPGTFRSRAVEWEETVHQDTGLLGFTTKQMHPSGPRIKPRAWYAHQDAQAARPRSFRTRGRPFAHNLGSDTVRRAQPPYSPPNGR